MKRDGRRIVKQEIKMVPVNNLVFAGPSDPSLLINSQWVSMRGTSRLTIDVAELMLSQSGGKWKAPVLQLDTMADCI